MKLCLAILEQPVARRLSADRDEDVQDGGLIDNTILNPAIPSLMR
ncbi:hypothetical protein [Nonomuraea indica]|uniref:Uncharacterized protein n=1 Tax=Nonomuraea indica TaxID=1581193 RepID=A0ABW8AEG4_9ACTN